MQARLPAHLEVSGLLRAAQADGDFGMVLNKGERDGGTILVVLLDKQGLGVLFERMPSADGSRKWLSVKTQVIDNKMEFEDYLDRRKQQDPDVWIVELTVADRERFVRDNLSPA
ncbi:DUF1491 family protein [Novosphingobium sp. MMS21-SN21R]|uniref:DUF1491 family protein n=1 Tax=Novosphingobium sp. MMS21-SN21R TaxID=2969298 RepID=UPI0028877A86|nr:DUF1491 family protein [Novosphingobium sp. MMS21-SN21R]MDT0506515.1 DUF1491 family protein [Novosphingobium sp. MMS21-SN21R]